MYEAFMEYLVGSIGRADHGPIRMIGIGNDADHMYDILANWLPVHHLDFNTSADGIRCEGDPHWVLRAKDIDAMGEEGYLYDGGATPSEHILHIRRIVAP